MPATSDKTIVSVSCPAKVNLTLHVSARHAEWGNRHGLDTLYAGVDIMDTVTVSERPQGAGPSLGMSGERLGDWMASDLGGRLNHAMRALEAMSRISGHGDDIRIDIVKRIPIAAGLAGGSTDAAGTILALDRLWELHWPLARLQAVASDLGADMPFCLSGGFAHGGGYGDIISPIGRSTMQYRSLVRSGYTGPVILGAYDERLSTAQVYEAFDRIGAGTGDDNDLQRAAISLHPRSGDAVRMALKAGARHAVVSGSGPTVAAFCTDVAMARALSALWRDNHAVDYVITARCPATPSIHVRHRTTGESDAKDTVKPIMTAAGRRA